MHPAGVRLRLCTRQHIRHEKPYCSVGDCDVLAEAECGGFRIFSHNGTRPDYWSEYILMCGTQLHDRREISRTTHTILLQEAAKCKVEPTLARRVFHWLWTGHNMTEWRGET